MNTQINFLRSLARGACLALVATASLASASQLLNISTRALVSTGDEVLIGGFIITGNEPKKVIVRALGPSVASTDFFPHLADPVLELHQSNGAVVVNDDWRDTQEQQIIDTGVAPLEEEESAIVATLAPGAHTAIVRGKDDDEGVGLVEVYDLDPEADSRLANVSTRSLVVNVIEGTAMIAGFIIGPEGSGDGTVVIRGLGPSLRGSGLATTLSDPNLTLYNSDGDVIGMNDDWMDDPNASEIAAVGLGPSDPSEAAFLGTFSPGAYTAVLSGELSFPDLDVGNGLVEVYQLE